MGLNGPATGRTDTDKNDREPRSLLDLKNNEYELFSTETDVALKFAPGRSSPTLPSATWPQSSTGSRSTASWSASTASLSQPRRIVTSTRCSRT